MTGLNRRTLVGTAAAGVLAAPAVARAQTPAFPAGAWNLATLGVHPDSQGKGLGSSLVRAGLAERPADLWPEQLERWLASRGLVAQ